MRASTLLRCVLLAFMVGSVELASAWSCQHPLDGRTVPDPVRFPNIFIGRVIEIKIDSQANPDAVELVGKVEVMERLRGNPAKIQELRYQFPKDLRITIGPTNAVNLGKPYLFLGDGGPLSISSCAQTLNLNPSLISFGDGCRLYRYRDVLGITQPKSTVCEDSSSQLYQGGFSNPMTEDELRELQWRELGIDWKPQ